MVNETTTSTRGTWVAHIDETKRGLAKLLARENITVRHDGSVSTAMFNLETRELVLPKWNNITVDQYDLLIGHEVAHAKYSDEVATLTAPDMTRGLHSYINVLEDTRIERLIQQEFPGLRGSFRRGYADFFNNGPIFNDIKTTADAAKFSFIDRVNIHYKIGASVEVPFSAEEQAILPRIDALRSMADAIALARELYAAEKARRDEQQQQQEEEQQGAGQPAQQQQQQTGESQSGDQSDASEDNGDEGDGDEGDGSEESSSDSDESDQQSQQPAPAQTGNGFDASEPVAQTDVQNTEAVRELTTAESNNEPTQVVLDTLSDEIIKKQTLSSVEYLADVDRFFNISADAKRIASEYLAKFNTKYGRTIAQLSQEFERRKAAKQYDRAKQSRTGRLDVNKLHAYKFRDDLFKSVTILPNGQSHGIVLLIDGSGSMAPVITDVLQQVLLFASFAKRVNVPVQAYVFGTCANTENVQWSAANTLYPDSVVRLVTLLDSTAPRWNDQLLAVAGFAARYDNDTHAAQYALSALPYTNLGDTPLFSALMLVERHIARLKSSKRLDKTTLFVLSDGANNRYVYTKPNESGRGFRPNSYRQHAALIIRDRVTSTTYVDAYVHNFATYTDCRGTATGLASALVDSIRKRHQTRVVALRIVTRRESPVGHGWHYGYNDLLKPNVDKLTDTFDKVRDAWKANEQYTLPTSDTYFDAALVIASSALDLDDETDFASFDTTGKSAKQIVASFKKTAVAATSNRVLINTIVPYIA